MKQVLDATKSKRPLNVADETDINKLHEAIASIENQIAKLDARIKAREITPEYKQLVIDSHLRMKEIAWKRMAIPVDKTLQHAEVVGQFNERLKMTQELLKLKERKNKAISGLDNLRRRAQSLVQMITKHQQKETDNAD